MRGQGGKGMCSLCAVWILGALCAAALGVCAPGAAQAAMRSPDTAVEAVEEDGGRSLSPVAAGRVAPVPIASRDILVFSASFPHETRPGVPSRGAYTVEVEDGIPRGWYTLELRREAAGEAGRFSLSCDSRRGGGTPEHQAAGPCPAAAFTALQEVIEAHGTAKLNGYYSHNTALGEGFSLNITYASGERLEAQAEGGAAVMPDAGLPIGEFVEFSRGLVAQTGQSFATCLPCVGPLTGLRVEVAFATAEQGPAQGEDTFLPGHYRMTLYSEEGSHRARAAVSYAPFAGVGHGWVTLWQAVIPASALDDARAFVEGRQLARLNGYRSTWGPGVPLEASFTLHGEYANGAELDAHASGPATALPAPAWWDARWAWDFFRELARKHGGEVRVPPHDVRP